MLSKHTELEKRLTISLLPVPIELVALVNEYLYHTEKTSPTIQQIRKAKNEISDLITNHTSVKMNEEIEEGQEIEDEYWRFCISIPTTHIYSQLYNNGMAWAIENEDYWPLSIEYYFGGRNCKVCGEYKKMYSYGPEEVTRGLTLQNMCKCLK